MKLKQFLDENQKYAGVIFDFNGVLLWDSHLQEKTWYEFSKSLRGKPFSNEEMSHVVHGRTNAFILNYLSGKSLSKKEIEALTDQKETTYRQFCLAEGEAFKLSPGAKELLDFCKEHDIPRTIATASPKANLDFFIKHLKLDRWFNPSIIAYDDGSFPGKPAPDIYLLAARNLGLEPQNCIVIEDAISGLKSAYEAGIGRIYALGPTRRHSELRNAEGSDVVISRLDEIPRDIFM